MYHKKEDPDFNMTFVLVNCHHNKTIYEVLLISLLLERETEIERV